MSDQVPVLLLDTNVWLDNYDPLRARHGAAMELIAFAYEREFTLAFSAGSVKDFYYVYCRNQKQELARTGRVVDAAAAKGINELAWACVRNMTTIATPVPMDGRTLWMAEQFRVLEDDLEDALILAACELAHVDFLVTGDERLRRKAPVAAYSAEEMLAFLRIKYA